MDNVDILVAARREQVNRYDTYLSAHENYHVTLVSSPQDALNVLADQDQHVDVLVTDNGLGDVYQLIGQVRLTYPRLIIILVDEDADFGLPGQADDISTEPFINDDLARRINRLMSERRVETLRSDSLPAVRTFAKHLRSASGIIGKQQAAVEACLDMGYDYVAYYHIETSDLTKIVLKAQVGPNPIKSVAPKQTSPDDLMTWVAKSGQSRIAGPQDSPNHPLVARGRLGAVACTPVVFSGTIYGVMVACRDQPGTINQEHVLMLELISAQLAAAVSKEAAG